MELNKLIKMTDKEYFEAEGLNFSTLKKLYLSPKHYKYALENPEPSTPAQTFGRAVHAATLDAEEFARSFYLYAGKLDRRTKEGREVVEMAGEREIVGLEVSDMAQAVLAIVPEIAQMVRESSIFWNDGNHIRKAKLDAYDPASGYMWDLKTTTDLAGFERAIYNFKYYAQAAYYRDAVLSAKMPFNGFRFIAVEKQPPYDVGIFELSTEYLELGKAEVDTLIAKLEMAETFDKWLGVNNGEVAVVNPPKWAQPIQEEM